LAFPGWRSRLRDRHLSSPTAPAPGIGCSRRRQGSVLGAIGLGRSGYGARWPVRAWASAPTARVPSEPRPHALVAEYPRPRAPLESAPANLDPAPWVAGMKHRLRLRCSVRLAGAARTSLRACAFALRSPA